MSERVVETVVVKDRFNAPIERAWKLVSAFDTNHRFIPGVESCQARGKGVGATRTLIGGPVRITQELKELDEARHRIAYAQVGKANLPYTQDLTTITLTAYGADACLVDWVMRISTARASAKTLKEAQEANIRSIVRAMKAHLELN